MEVKFDRTDTKAIKGIAVLMMLYYHLIAFPNRYPVGFEAFRSVIPGFAEGGYLMSFAELCGFCVQFFFFLGGYGLYHRLQRPGFSVKDTILNLYYAYWKIFFIFIPIGFLFFARSGPDINRYAAKFSSYGSLELITLLISEFMGLTCNINGEWWFFFEYVCILPVGYLFCKATRKIHDFWLEFLMVLGIDLLLCCVIHKIPSIELFSSISDHFLFANFVCFDPMASAFFGGIVAAKYDVLRKIKQMLLSVPFAPVLSAGSILALILLRTYVMGTDIDIILCTVMIAMASVALDASKPVKGLLAFLGKHSTNMWLIHSFYCYYYLEMTYLVYCSEYPFACMTVLVVLSLMSSILVDAFYDQAGKLAIKLKYRTKSNSQERETA